MHQVRNRRAPLFCAVLLGIAVGTIACSRTPRVDPRIAAGTAARASIEQGCYDCLLRAREIYAAADSGARAPIFRRERFEVELLIAARERELGLPAGFALGRARELGEGVLADADLRRLVRIVEAIPADPNGLPLEPPSARRARRGASAPAPEDVTWLAAAPVQPLVRDYLAAATACAAGDTPASAKSDPARGLAADAAPLLFYRAAICDPIDAPALREVRVAVPTFVDAAYFLAQQATERAGETGGDEARALLMVARSRFPDAIGIHFTSGRLEQTTGRCAEALEHFDRVLTREPKHDRAMLGRTVCLTGVKRHDEAIVAAATVVSLGSPLAAQAHYWRAINWQRVGRLDSARRDIERAKFLARSYDIFALAGVIEYDQGDLPQAEADLRAAVRLPANDGPCTAELYLALTLGKSARLEESVQRYEDAMRCFDMRVTMNRERIAAIQASPEGSAAFKGYRIGQLEVSIGESRTAWHAAAFNGATDNARLGRMEKAKELLDIAAGDPKLAEAVAKLRGYLERPP